MPNNNNNDKWLQKELEYNEKVREWYYLPMLKCPHCDFKNVYQKSIDHHMKYTHIGRHPSPPNERLPTMTEKDYMDWEDAMSGRTGRRSADLKVI